MLRELTIHKGEHVHRITYESGQEAAVLDALIEMVNNPELNFDWFDAATLSHQIGKDLAEEIKNRNNQQPTTNNQQPTTNNQQLTNEWGRATQRILARPGKEARHGRRREGRIR
jgi:hypothetical protein